jgi:hypothetical protein
VRLTSTLLVLLVMVLPLGCASHGQSTSDAPSCDPATMKCDGDGNGGSDLTIWPNDQSQAMSDPWLVAHHDELRQMQPRVLVLNFANSITTAQVDEFVNNRVFPGIREGSRYHGYSDPAAPAFLAPKLVGIVDLTDAFPPIGWNSPNSTKLPLKATLTAADQYRFDYSALFTQAFADEMAIPDPNDPTRNLTMCELFETGDVHDVWLNTNDDPGDRPLVAEEIDNAQRYDDTLTAIPGQFQRCGGNGCFAPEDVPPCKVSVRFGGLTMSRGPGCKLHATGHAFEGRALRVIPYLITNFAHYGNYDFATRLGAPFASWYQACTSAAPCVAVTGDDNVSWRASTGQTGVFSPFGQGCGNVHFAPNSRTDYDMKNPSPVLATCEHFGLHDGPGGSDLATLVSPDTWASLDGIAPDCGDGWNVYWRQSMPGLGNHATAADGTPMKNWWPFLFY